MIKFVVAVFVFVVVVFDVYCAARTYTLNTVSGPSEIVAAARAKAKKLDRWSKIVTVTALLIVFSYLLWFWRS
jgi:hypothetical protein